MLFRSHIINSSHFSVGFTSDIFTALDVQDELQTLYTSGTVFHAFLGERLSDWKSAANLVRKIAENYKLPYYTLSPIYSVCRKHGYISGEVKKCPICGEETEIYSRITGYYRPVKNWNDGKAQEYKDRKSYDIGTSKLTKKNNECGCNLDTNKVDSIIEEDKEIVEKRNEYQNKIMLFGTKTCPNCKIAKTLLEKANIAYSWVDAEENKDLTKYYDVKQAPTLVIVNDENMVEKIVNLSNIKKYIMR